MAKINARGAYQVGPTLFTIKTVKYSGPDDDSDWSERHHAWRMRSDGQVQARLVKAVDVKTGRVTKEMA